MPRTNQVSGGYGSVDLLSLFMFVLPLGEHASSDLDIWSAKAPGPPNEALITLSKSTLFTGDHGENLGWVPPPPLTDNHCAQKSLAERGVPPPLNGKNPLSIFWRVPLIPPDKFLLMTPYNALISNWNSFSVSPGVPAETRRHYPHTFWHSAKVLMFLLSKPHETSCNKHLVQTGLTLKIKYLKTLKILKIKIQILSKQ